jgi:hypothetical protein
MAAGPRRRSVSSPLENSLASMNATAPSFERPRALSTPRFAAAAIASLSLALASANAGAQAPRLDRIEVLEYGIYAANVAYSERDANWVLQSRVGDVRHVKRTRTVPAKLGVRFGFGFVVAGSPTGAKVTLRKVTRFPPPGLRSPAAKEPLKVSEVSLTRTIGREAGYVDYGFDDPWELVPGTWTIELWHGDRKLATQSFTVVKP